MKQVYQVALLLLSCGIVTGCNGQNTNSEHPSAADARGQRVGGNFENSEFTYYGIPKNVSAVDTSAGWNQEGQKILLTGTVLLPDGKTPAPGVILYYYHTNIEGRYVHKPQEKRSMPPNDLGQTHGYIRGWVKTGDNGKYFIYSVRPGTYPSNDEVAHVHATIKEPNELNEYYIDDFVFDDDKLLTLARRKKMENRAGSGVVRLAEMNGIKVGERNIILGLNIPGYAKPAGNQTHSGRNVGEDVFSFTPYHLGPR